MCVLIKSQTEQMDGITRLIPHFAVCFPPRAKSLVRLFVHMEGKRAMEGCNDGIYQIIRLAKHPARADKSAVAAINRALRMVELVSQSA